MTHTPWASSSQYTDKVLALTGGVVPATAPVPSSEYGRDTVNGAERATSPPVASTARKAPVPPARGNRKGSPELEMSFNVAAAAAAVGTFEAMYPSAVKEFGVRSNDAPPAFSVTTLRTVWSMIVVNRRVALERMAR